VVLAGGPASTLDDSCMPRGCFAEPTIFVRREIESDSSAAGFFKAHGLALIEGLACDVYVHVYVNVYVNAYVCVGWSLGPKMYADPQHSQHHSLCSNSWGVPSTT
jgi:hypothetical protein